MFPIGPGIYSQPLSYVVAEGSKHKDITLEEVPINDYLSIS